jgi:folate-dependent tRNA-U54 methylase TrmFO/GidA
VGTPAIFAEPLAGDSRWPTCTKARQLCAEHGWPFADSLATLADRLRCRVDPEIPAAGFCPGWRSRWESMAAGLAAGLAAGDGKKNHERLVDAGKAA